MKISTNNRLSLQNIVRFGVVLIAIINVLGPAEGVRTSDDYSIVDKPSSKSREIRGFKKPHQMLPAYGFGKRNNVGFQPLSLDRHETITPFRTKNALQRSAVELIVQFFKMNPQLTPKIESNLLLSNEEDVIRPSLSERYKKTRSDVIYYFDQD